jgi:hypothetical protein
VTADRDHVAYLSTGSNRFHGLQMLFFFYNGYRSFQPKDKRRGIDTDIVTPPYQRTNSMEQSPS